VPAPSRKFSKVSALVYLLYKNKPINEITTVIKKTITITLTIIAIRKRIAPRCVVNILRHQGV
jgi:hypothetical protein